MDRSVFTDRPTAKKRPVASRFFLRIALFAAIVVLFAIAAWTTTRSPDNNPTLPGTPAYPLVSLPPTELPLPLATFRIAPRTLDELLALPADQLADVDIARMNLLCATNLPGPLPGAGNLDVEKSLARLDEYARRVRYWTDQSLWDFQQRPEKFENSEAKFRVLLLISVLQQDFGIHYNDRGTRNCDFSDSRNAFIHGMIDDANGGTCASMPVMYVAVGRRLGYPMKLVPAKTHIFARWEDPRTSEKFNIEGTNPRFDHHPDSYYRRWPAPIFDAEMKQGWYLQSMSAKEELGVFLQNRAWCLMDHRRFDEAETAFAQSRRIDPRNPIGQQQRMLTAQAHIPFVDPVDVFPDNRPSANRRSDPFAELERINAMNRANRQRTAQHFQPPIPQPPQPNADMPPNPYQPQPFIPSATPPETRP
ncbi:MAG: transglutaminase family protein [Phycisphaerales bacterium]